MVKLKSTFTTAMPNRLIALGTILILHQQKDRVGGVKNGRFADFQYCIIYADIVGGWV